MSESELGEFEDLEALRNGLSSYLESCRLQGVCPMCTEPCSRGIGTGRLGDGIFCSLECFHAFRAKYDYLLNSGGIN